MGEAIVGIMAVLTQLRVSIIRDNTRRGLEHARSEGRVGGRPAVMSYERIAAAVQMRGNRDNVARIGRMLGVGASSVARALDRYHREQLHETTNESERQP
jgi:DNA invertase Pin-like site-specific DNA recombinase